MEPSDVIVLTPPTSIDAGIAVAANRSGARGILDLEFCTDLAVAQTAIERLRRFSPNRYGAKVGLDGDSILSFLLSLSPIPTWVVLAGGEHPGIAGWIGRLKAAGVEVLFEATTFDEAVRGQVLGVDGLILKGHDAGGRIGADSTFILLQRWQRHLSDFTVSRAAIWAQGGIGLHTAAACLTAGARGVVLDSQVLLARESLLDDEPMRRVRSMDGSETMVRDSARVYARPDWPLDQPWPIGPDAALAAPLADRFVTVGGIVHAVVAETNRLLDLSRKLKPLAEDAELARRHGTRFPILQGPMTRVSDTAAFAAAVAEGGALPFLALALLRKADTEKLLRETQQRLSDPRSLPWGVGILGFVPPEIRNEQLAAVRECKPPFAIIAGGRPDQAKEFEAHGIHTYLHVPSPGLLKQFLKDGARRFIFEGRECGGHVGPRTSFVLWEAMIGALGDWIISGGKAEELHVVFAGGVHDALSASMVSALAVGLAEKGAAIGVLMGTAYLFTHEAVAAGAITERFQQEAVACGETVLLETGPGHAIRCIPSPYAKTFAAEKRRLQAEGKPPLEVALTLERMNLGRLRIASKGLDRSTVTAARADGLVQLSADQQFLRGMYMIGQIAALHDSITSIAELHADVCSANSPQIEIAAAPPEPEAPPPCDVAIIGMACFYPKAGGLWPYWENILAKVQAVEEIPATHWDWRPYYDADPRAPDKIVSKWGGFLDDVQFDPLVYGITPKSLPSIEPMQLLLLEAVQQAIADAGYANRPFARERVAAILGVGGGGAPLSVGYGLRSCLPLFDSVPSMPVRSAEILRHTKGLLPEWTEDSFPGILLNVAVGRVANRFNFGGPNMAIDAACGSSLAAVQAGVRELEMGTSDLAFVMGADAMQTPFAYVAFSKTFALSPRGRCRPFDAEADGIALSEGISVAVLKRLADAERDGDRIYAVIKGVGASSDGRDKGLTAPRAEGQLRALRRAYAQARIAPSTVGLVEAHGTGTVVGDQTEATALGQLWREAGAAPQSVALGSVKSMIGHSKCAAGLAGLIKTTFALHHKVLPPTLAEKPNPRANLDGGPLYLNTESRPWVKGDGLPRRAGVSAFGFGGTNFHVVLEEYRDDPARQPLCGMMSWPVELFVWRRANCETLLKDLRLVRDALAAGAAPTMAELAASLWESSRTGFGQPTLAIVAGTLTELSERLDLVLKSLADRVGQLSDPRGIYYADKPAATKTAFLFPGQGSQYPNMLAQLAVAFPEVREKFDEAERALAGKLDQPLGRLVFPPSPFTPEQEQASREALQRTDVAQPALGAASLAMFELLAELGIEPDFLAGHSYGEYVALAAAGSLPFSELIALSHLRGEVIRAASPRMPGGMIAVEADSDAVATALAGHSGITIANHNSPKQTVIAGGEAELSRAQEALKQAGLRAQRIPVACGFHSPLVAAAREPLAQALAALAFAPPRRPVFSNTTAAPHHPKNISRQLADHLISPVRFREEIEALYDAGARLFVEIGPQTVLTGLVGQILEGKPHVALATDQKCRPGLVQLAHVLGQLLVNGVHAKLGRLYRGRGLKPFDISRMNAGTGKAKPTPTTWVVNTFRSRPVNAPEPVLLGQAPPANAERGTRNTGSKPQTRVGVDSPPARATAKLPAQPVKENVKMTDAESPHPLPIPPTSNRDRKGAEEVMLRFQETMARFLDTQRSVMLGYLGVDPGAVLPAATPALTRVAAMPSPNGQQPPSAPRPAATPAANGHVTNGVAIIKREAEPVVPDTNKPAALDRDNMMAQLLELVSERTGYPRESLSIDLDLEADLGVDSIKRVEVLSSLADMLGEGGANSSALEMEKLTSIKTIRGIVDYVYTALEKSNSAVSVRPDGASAAPSRNGDPDASHAFAAVRSANVQRLVVRLTEAPLGTPRFAPPVGAVLITDDRQGIARELADRLADLDVRAVLLHDRTIHPDASASAYATDLKDPVAVGELLERLRAEVGPIAGLIHLLPLAEPVAGEARETRARRDVFSLYLLARGLEEELCKAKDSLLVAATGMGGGLGFSVDLPEPFHAGHGAVTGFMKCIAFEWPEALVRVVDLDPSRPATEHAEHLLSELGSGDGPNEVGWLDGQRVTAVTYAGPVDRQHVSPVRLDAESVVLVTGGARGITARVALELAKRFRPTLVLAGRSPLPAPEPIHLVRLDSPADLKAALMADFKREGKPATPAFVEQAYNRLVQDREIRANLEALRKAGAKVHYYAVDVRDSIAFGELLDELKKKFGRIDGVIHGAGVIEDKLLKDKVPESFERVFATKVDSALTLAAKLDPDQTRFLVLFSSLASRYGNKGQSDYAAANDMLSKLAADLDRRWHGRVVAMAWGPWASVGMVAHLEKHLVAKGLQLISPEAGPEYVIDELLYGKKGVHEVVIAGGAEQPIATKHVATPHPVEALA